MRTPVGTTSRYLSLAFVLLLSAVPFLCAQTPGTGAVVGKLTDSSGAVVPDVDVQVTSSETGLSRKVTTNSEGLYRVPLLPAGSYSVTVQAPGFETTTLRNVRVVVTETTVVDMELKIGALATKVEVAASPELVQSTSAALGRVTSERAVVALPLANRNFTQILALSPGITTEAANAAALGKSSQNVTANGARGSYNNFQFNGVDANNIADNSASGSGAEVGLAIPAPDTIAEFKVQTALYDASYGRNAGANVDIVSKSGTNEYHGSIWEFFRNEALNANDFFLNRSAQTRPVLKQNQFGFTFGGPIRRNKLFFFGSHEGTRQINGATPGTSSVSTFLPPLTNDRSRSALGALFGGQRGARGGVAVAPDGSNINPVALAILNFKFPNGSFAVPSPQLVLPGGVGQSSFSLPARFQDNQFSVNVDYLVTAKNILAARFFSTSTPQTTPFRSGAATVPGWGFKLDRQNRMLVLVDTHQFSPKLINEFRFGYIRFNGVGSTIEPILNSDIGMTSTTGQPGMAGISVTGLFSIGPGTTPEPLSTTDTFVWRDTVSYSFGRHILKTGVEAKRHQLTVFTPFGSRGILTFLSFPDFLLGMSAAQNGTAFSNVGTSLAGSGYFGRDERYTDLSGFIQDDIRITRRLTLNVGLRYEFSSPPSDIKGRMANFDRAIAEREPPTTGTYSGWVVPSNYDGVLPPGVVKRSDTGLWSTSSKDFGPRLGFALRVLDKPRVILIRGGYGIYYQRVNGQFALQTVYARPFAAQIRATGAANAAATFQVPFNPPVPAPSTFPSFVPRDPTSSEALVSFAPYVKNPYVQAYSLNVQYEVARDLMLEVGYVGSKSTRLPFLPRFNQALIATPQNPVHGVTTTSVANVSNRLPWLGVGAGSYGIDSTLNSNYNSLQASLTKRFGRGVQFLASYTWSKSLDTSSGRDPTDGQELNLDPGDQTDFRRSNYGPSGFDRTQRFILSFVYEPPDLRRGTRVLQQVLSRWQFSGVLLFQSGVPFSVTDSLGASIFGVSASYAQCTGAASSKSGSVESRLNAYFNTSAFLRAPALFDGTGFGNCGRNILRGPSQRNLDLSMQKTTRLTEKSNLQFRGEVFNLTNTPKFGLPGANVAAPLSVGVISATVANPRVIQLALKYNF